jgi:hypothetical protein
MAILVSNPSTVQFTGAPTEPQDPAVNPLDAVFTEELANAMQPIALAAEGVLKAKNALGQEAENPLADLQILPPDVLLNAVGEANFAYTPQANSAVAAPLLTDGILDAAQANEVLSEDQAAELAAASLAAQMAVPLVQIQTAPSGQVIAQGEMDASVYGVTDAAGQQLPAQTALPEPTTATLPVGPKDLKDAGSSLSAATLAADQMQMASQVQQDTSAMVAGKANQTTQDIAVDSNSLRAFNNDADQLGPLNSEIATPKIQNSDVSLAAPVSQVALNVNESTLVKADDNLDIKQAFADLPPDLKSQTTIVKIEAGHSPLSLSEASDLLTSEKSIGNSALVSSDNAMTNGPVQATAANAQVVEGGAQQILAANTTTLNSTFSKTERVGVSQTVELDSQDTAGVGPVIDAVAKVEAPPADFMKESALKFDAKLGSQQQNDEAALKSLADSAIVSQLDLTTQQNLASLEQSEPIAKGFEEISSTFVSSLVGGPQRSITTAMDWVALKPQESPRPVMPHELRLDAGAVQVEIQRMVKQGGGHVVMELTPPDQSKFTIELKLDDMGGAYLKVEGVSDSTKTRLEQSAPQLQEQFQQMGLNLQLDMRQNRDSSSSGAAEWTSNESGFDNNQPQETTPQATRAAAAERARKNNGGQVYLYA